MPHLLPVTAFTWMAGMLLALAVPDANASSQAGRHDHAFNFWTVSSDARPSRGSDDASFSSTCSRSRDRRHSDRAGSIAAAGHGPRASVPPARGVVEDPQKMLSELARLGARLIIQRAVEEEFDSWLGRGRYERRPRAPAGKRNGFRARTLQSAEGELRIEIPQVREAAAPFVSKLFRQWHCKRLLRTDPLRAMIVGAFVRGLSMRDVESLCEEVGLGKTSKSTVARICTELHERFEAFKRRDLYEVRLVVLFLDAIYLPVRPSGPKEGVICAWGITENGERALVSVRLGMRESKEDWMELGRDLISRGLPAPRLVVADGAPGLIAAVEEIWPRADRQHCAVHRLRNLQAKLPKLEHDRGSLQLLERAERGYKRQGRQAPPPGRDQRPRARRLRVGRSLSGRGRRRPRRAPALPAQTPRAVAVNESPRAIARGGRRTKVMGRFPGETSCLSLVWAVLDLFFSHASNGATFTDLDRQHLYRIKYPPTEPETIDEETTAA